MGLMNRAGAKASSSFSEFLWTTLNIAFDSILAIFGKILLIPFVIGPLWTRMRFGIRAAEPVFRSPTQSSKLEDLAKLSPEKRVESFSKEMLRSVDRRRLEKSPADFMSFDLWTVDYPAARDANVMLAKRELGEEDLELSVWELDGEGKWTVWRVQEA